MSLPRRLVEKYWMLDEGKQAVAFANVMLLSLPDSGFVGGVATQVSVKNHGVRL
ncbi:MAG: hypothetical protein LBU03_06430 [Tannerellaceae bacterium]|jgi:hypothetical protein|nr:hypothetical protein [Tannerellaceae bacterium]